MGNTIVTAKIGLCTSMLMHGNGSVTPWLIEQFGKLFLAAEVWIYTSFLRMRLYGNVETGNAA
jgi:hypothetical protein